MTPSAWWWGIKALQVGARAAVQSSSNTTALSHNSYYDGVNWKFIGQDYASEYRLSNADASHRWYASALGTAGSVINWSQVMVLDGSGNLQVVGTSDATAFRDLTNTAYYLDPANTGTSLNVAGSVVAAGNVTAYSDIRVKANIEPIHGALDKISQINGVTYTRTDLDDKERRYGGVIAQEIEAVLPEAVFDNGDKKAVDYNATIGLLIEAVKEQQAQILELKLEIQQLKGN